MHVSYLDSSLWALSVAGQFFLLAVLLHRRFYRSFPVFTSYIFYCSVSDLLVFFLFRHASRHTYLSVYFAVNLVPEVLLQLGILLEVARNVLNPVKGSLPKAALTVLAAMLVTGTALALLLSIHSSPAGFSRLWQYFLQVNFAVAILRVVIFSAIALFSQMLGIGWKNHVFQIATGFASYSVLALLIQLAHRYLGSTSDAQYLLMEQFGVVGWCMALGYWSYALAKKEAPRKEFSPKMEKLLLSISEASRENRIAYRK